MHVVEQKFVLLGKKIIARQLLEEKKVRHKRVLGVMVKPQKLQVASDELQKMLDSNMDQAPQRRIAREAFREIQHQINHCLMKVHACFILDALCSLWTTAGCVNVNLVYLRRIPYEGLKIEESYEVNSRGLEIFLKSWLPESNCPVALIFYCHGYGETCTFAFEGIARKLALSGYGVFAMDYPGFGLSDGLHGYIPSLDRLSNDVVEHYSKIKENPKFRNLPSYLFGQSLGGAVALKVHLKQPNAWNGAILVAPMCKFADHMIPPWFLVQILIGIAHLFPKLKIVPHQNFVQMAFRDLRKRELAVYNIIAYKDTARLWTALECLRTAQELERRLEEVTLPLLILHGEADVVTDPFISRALFEKASSSDKVFKLYKDAYHSLLEGETDEMIFQVLSDIISWLDERCMKGKKQPEKNYSC